MGRDRQVFGSALAKVSGNKKHQFPQMPFSEAEIFALFLVHKAVPNICEHDLGMLLHDNNA